MKKLFAAWAGAVAIIWSAGADTTINPANRFAWGANIGWVNWRGDVAHGGVIGEFVCSGSIWAANVGWINLGDGRPVNRIQYQNTAANDYGVNHDGLGNLRGFAWGANIGWVNFEPLGAPRVDLQTGILSGYAWGANVGWISLSNAMAQVTTDTIQPGVDSDGDDIVDAWELRNFGDLLTADAVSDADDDGVSDRQESMADTNPRDRLSYLRITDFDTGPGGSPIAITWTSRQSRHYRIWRTDDLAEPIDWTDDILGLVYPDPGASTTRNFPGPAAPQSYFQIEVLKPLSP